jgi:hypothetical protein
MKVHRSVRTCMSAPGVGIDGEQYLLKICCPINDKVRRPTREEWVKDEPGFFEWVD